MIAHTITLTHTREASLKMRSSLTRVSSFQVDTITTWMHSTQKTVTAVAGPPQVGVFRVLLRHVRELPGQRHDLEQDQDPEQHHEKEPKKSYRSMLDDHALTIAYLLSIGNRFEWGR